MVLEKGVRDTNRRRHPLVGGSGGIPPNIFKIDVVRNGLSGIIDQAKSACYYVSFF